MNNYKRKKHIPTQKQNFDPIAHIKFNKNQVCPRCFRPKESCICNEIRSFDTNLKVIILQHPQEQYKAINSGHLAHLILKNSTLDVGLSWAGIKSLAGQDESPSQWGILFLRLDDKSNEKISIYDRNKQKCTAPVNLHGIIAIDSSWRQAKALWWRNPWFNRLYRISLNTNHISFRKQLHTEGLSTIEAISFVLEEMEGNKELGEYMRSIYLEKIINPAYNVKHTDTNGSVKSSMKENEKENNS